MPWQYRDLPPSEVERYDCIHNPWVKITDWVKLTNIVVITHYEILSELDEDYRFPEILTGQ